MKTVCPLVLGIKKTGCFFFFFFSLHSSSCRSGASCVYLIINACGLHYNSFKLIISESWIKELRLLLYGFGVSALYVSKLNLVHALVEQALRKWLNIINIRK